MKLLAKLFIACEPYDEEVYDLDRDGKGTQHVIGHDFLIHGDNQLMEMPLGVNYAYQVGKASVYRRMFIVPVGEITYALDTAPKEVSPVIRFPSNGKAEGQDEKGTSPAA